MKIASFVYLFIFFIIAQFIVTIAKRMCTGRKAADDTTGEMSDVENLTQKSEPLLATSEEGKSYCLALLNIFCNKKNFSKRHFLFFFYSCTTTTNIRRIYKSSEAYMFEVLEALFHSSDSCLFQTHSLRQHQRRDETLRVCRSNLLQRPTNRHIRSHFARSIYIFFNEI